MERYREIYGALDWYKIDDSGRVVFYMQNRRDHPGGEGTIDFPGITILQYAGDGLFSMEEDYWPEKLATETFLFYETARKQHDPDHRAKATRSNWGKGPVWTRGAPSYHERSVG